jgi:6-phosphogluconolactonase (cycloisomerase 2 family)
LSIQPRHVFRRRRFRPLRRLAIALSAVGLLAAPATAGAWVLGTFAYGGGPESDGQGGYQATVYVGFSATKPCKHWEFNIGGLAVPAFIARDGSTDTDQAQATVHLVPGHGAVVTGSVYCRAGNGLDYVQVPFGPVNILAPGVPPDMQPKLSDAEKAGLNRGAALNAGIAAGFGVAAGVAALIACPPCAAIAAVAVGLSGGFGAMSAYGWFQSADPPDPNYKAIEQPAKVTMPVITAGSGVTADIAFAGNAVLGNMAESVGLEHAFTVTIEREWGAYDANDASWVTRQGNAAKQYATQLADSLDRSYQLRRAFATAVDNDAGSGLPSDISSQVPAALAALLAAPVPAATTTLYHQAGLSDADLANAAQVVQYNAVTKPGLSGKLTAAFSLAGSGNGETVPALRSFAGQATVTPATKVNPPRALPLSTGAAREANCLSWKQTKATGCAAARAMQDAAFSVVSPDGRFLYVAARLGDAIAAFARDPLTGRLKQLAGKAGCVQETGSNDPQGCGAAHGIVAISQLAISADGKFLYGAARQSAAVSVFRRKKDGSLAFVSCMETHSMLKAPCKEAPGLGDAQGIALAPNGRFVFATGGSSSTVTVFRRDRKRGTLTLASCVTERTDLPMCGPARPIEGVNRLAVSRNGRFLYATALDDSALVTFAVDANGGLRQVACIGGNHSSPDPACTAGVGLAYPESLALSPDGRSLYVTAAGSGGAGSLAILAVDPTTGIPTQPVGTVPCVSSNTLYDPTCALGDGLDGAFGVVVTPDGQSVYVGSYVSNAVTMYARNPATGALTRLYTCISYDATACKRGAGLDHAGWLALSPDGRFLYANAPHANSVVLLQRRLPAVAPTVVGKGKLRRGKLRLTLACAKTSIAGCYGVLHVTKGGTRSKQIAYTIAAGKQLKLKLAFPGKAGAARLVVTAFEPTGRRKKVSRKLRIA